ncbi:MAG: tetratricopeptide repeat protein [Candidatus Binatia bacterium]
MLATAFLLAALLAHGAAPWTWRGSAASGAAALASLGAKEAGVALYPLLLRDVLIRPTRRPLADWLRGYAGVGAAGVLYVALRRHALGEMVGTAPSIAPTQRSPLEVLAAVGTYAGKLLWPFPLNAYIDHVPVTATTVLAALLLLAALALAARHCARAARAAAVRRPVDRADAGAVAGYPVEDSDAPGRTLSLSAVGGFLLADRRPGGARLGRLASPASRRAAAAVVSAVLLAAAGATAQRCRVWRDDVALWEDTEAKSQQSGMAARNLGTAYQQAGRAADARAAFARALKRRNDARGLQTIHNNLGTLALMDGDFAAARRAYEEALAAAPDAPDTLFNLALAILHGGGSTPEAGARGPAQAGARPAAEPARRRHRGRPGAGPAHPRRAPVSLRTPPPRATAAPVRAHGGRHPADAGVRAVRRVNARPPGAGIASRLA